MSRVEKKTKTETIRVRVEVGLSNRINKVLKCDMGETKGDISKFTRKSLEFYLHYKEKGLILDESVNKEYDDDKHVIFPAAVSKKYYDKMKSKGYFNRYDWTSIENEIRTYDDIYNNGFHRLSPNEIGVFSRIDEDDFKVLKDFCEKYEFDKSYGEVLKGLIPMISSKERIQVRANPILFLNCARRWVRLKEKKFGMGQLNIWEKFEEVLENDNQSNKRELKTYDSGIFGEFSTNYILMEKFDELDDETIEDFFKHSINKMGDKDRKGFLETVEMRKKFKLKWIQDFPIISALMENFDELDDNTIEEFFKKNVNKMNDEAREEFMKVIEIRKRCGLRKKKKHNITFL